MKTTKVMISVFSILLLASCDQINKSFEDTINPRNMGNDSGTTGTVTFEHRRVIKESEKPEVYRNIFENAELLDNIQKELEHMPRFKGKSLMMYQSMYIYNYQGGRVSVNIQNPDITENIDNYVYANGQWLESSPVRVTGNISMVDFLFPLSKLRFSTAAKIYEQAVKRAETVEGAAPIDHIYFNHMFIKTFKRPYTRWYVSIQGDRDMYTMNFNVDGKFTDAKDL